MCDRTKKEKISDDYLKTLEKVKEQYQQYVEISGLYTLPIQQEEEPIQYQPPSLENPLTTNTTSSDVWRRDDKSGKQSFDTRQTEPTGTY